MSDEASKDEPEVELEPLEVVEPVTEASPAEDGAGDAGQAAPAAASEAAAPEPDDGAGGVEGQWVWQYAAPPPPPSFGARFFSGTALPELYRFLGCGLLVVLGAFLPWGPQQVEVPADAAALAADPEATTVLELVIPPEVTGVVIPGGALALALGLWLMFASARGIYSGRQPLLPVLLMLEPAVLAWERTLAAWGHIDGDWGRFGELFSVAGTGVMLTLVGATYPAVKFVFVLVKVFAKKDDKGRGGRAKKGAAKGAKGEGAEDGKDKAKGAKGKRGRKGR